MRVLWQGALLFGLFIQSQVLAGDDAPVDDSQSSLSRPLLTTSLPESIDSSHSADSGSSSDASSSEAVVTRAEDEATQSEASEPSSNSSSSEKAASGASSDSSSPEKKTEKKEDEETQDDGLRSKLLDDKTGGLDSSDVKALKGMDLCYPGASSFQAGENEGDDHQPQSDALERRLLIAAIVAKESSGEEALVPDFKEPPRDLMEALDTLFFETPYSANRKLNCFRNCVKLSSLRHFMGMVLGLAGGVATTTAATGVYRKATRDLLMAPQDTVLGNVLIGTSVVALSPAFMGLFANIGKGLPVSSKCCFSPSEDFLKAKQDFVFPISWPHKALKGLLGVAVGINSCTTLAQMIYFELENVTGEDRDQAYRFVGGMGPFYLAADFAMNFNNGKREIDRFFFKHIYPKTAMTKKQKAILKTRINIMKSRLKDASAWQILNRYKNLTDSSRHTEDQTPWKASWFLTEGLGELKTSSPELQWTNFAQDIEFLEGISPRRKVADFTAKLLIAFGTWGRFETLVYGSNLMLGWFDVDPVTAFWMSGVLAAAGAGGKALWEANLHHNFMRILFCAAGTHISRDNRCVQSMSVSTAGVSAALIAIAGISLGMKALEGRYPLGAEVVLLGSAAVLNFSAYLESLRQQALFSTRSVARKAVSTVCKIRKKVDIDMVRRSLINKCCRLEATVERLTDNATNTLYRWLGSFEATKLKWTD